MQIKDSKIEMSFAAMMADRLAALSARAQGFAVRDRAETPKSTTEHHGAEFGKNKSVQRLRVDTLSQSTLAG